MFSQDMNCMHECYFFLYIVYYLIFSAVNINTFFRLKKRRTRIDVYETLCPKQMLVHIKGGQVGGGSGGRVGGCESRIEVIVKMEGGSGSGRGVGVRVGGWWGLIGGEWWG